MLSRSILALALGLIAAAAPARRKSITTLSSAAVDAFAPFSALAAAGYCDPATTLTWTCGANCDGVPDFEPVASGGDGAVNQFWFVGYAPSQKTVVVSHQGTHPEDILPLLTDVSIVQLALDDDLFPGLPSDIMVHQGFRNAQAKAAPDVLAAVQKTMKAHGATAVTMVGHSLGGAIALLDSVYLPLHLPANTTFSTVVYGLPRVGNQAFADYVDAQAKLTHVNNMEDLVPIIPGRSLGYVHPSGEVHIQDSGAWMACPGQDNPDDECTVGDVPSITGGDISNHDGPYNGVHMGC